MTEVAHRPGLLTVIPPNRRHGTQVERFEGLYKNEETFEKTARFADTRHRIGLVLARTGTWCRRSA